MCIRPGPSLLLRSPPWGRPPGSPPARASRCRGLPSRPHARLGGPPPVVSLRASGQASGGRSVPPRHAGLGQGLRAPLRFAPAPPLGSASSALPFALNRFALGPAAGSAPPFGLRLPPARRACGLLYASAGLRPRSARPGARSASLRGPQASGPRLAFPGCSAKEAKPQPPCPAIGRLTPAGTLVVSP